IMFGGRVVFHPELGKKILDRIAELVDGAAKVESEPRLDGRNMVMVLAPDKRARQSQAARGVPGDEHHDGVVVTGAPSAAPTPPGSAQTSVGSSANGPSANGPSANGQSAARAADVPEAATPGAAAVRDDGRDDDGAHDAPRDSDTTREG
ncbi:MAG: translation initiation factor IF-3 C-terminal domain-containing protein, partial [Acidimicrobiales bacterium]